MSIGTETTATGNEAWKAVAGGDRIARAFKSTTLAGVSAADTARTACDDVNRHRPEPITASELCDCVDLLL